MSQCIIIYPDGSQCQNDVLVIKDGLCNKHYLRSKIHGSPLGGAPKRSRAPIPERFWSFVAIGEPDACWEWQGGRHPRGYGGFQMNGRLHRAHRVAWELTHESIPKGVEICHSCDNPPCVNPAHLFLGTHQDNMTDMKSKQRYRVIPQPGEPNPQAKLTDVEVLEIRRAYAAGEGPQSALALRFGVSRALIGLITTRKIWTHLPAVDLPADAA